MKLIRSKLHILSFEWNNYYLLCDTIPWRYTYSWDFHHLNAQCKQSDKLNTDTEMKRTHLSLPNTKLFIRGVEINAFYSSINGNSTGIYTYIHLALLLYITITWVWYWYSLVHKISSRMCVDKIETKPEKNTTQEEKAIMMHGNFIIKFRCSSFSLKPYIESIACRLWLLLLLLKYCLVFWAFHVHFASTFLLLPLCMLNVQCSWCYYTIILKSGSSHVNEFFLPCQNTK